MIAEKLGYKYLDSGSLYRSLALKLYEKNSNLENILANLDKWMNDISIDFRYKKGKVIKPGSDVTVIKSNDLIYYDKNAGHSMLIDNESMTIIEERNVVVVI